MLALTREDGEFIDIVTAAGETIEICLRRSWHGRARLGFTADPAISIQRREVRLAKENGTTSLAEKVAARKRKTA